MNFNLNLLKNDFKLLDNFLLQDEPDMNLFKNNLEVFYNRYFNVVPVSMETSNSSENSSSTTNISQDETKKMVEETLKRNKKNKLKTFTHS